MAAMVLTLECCILNGLRRIYGDWKVYMRTAETGRKRDIYNSAEVYWT